MAKRPSLRKKDPAIYQLKVQLRYITPLIWRRIEVHDDITLERLHQILQIVFGWMNSHLHGFQAGNRTIGMPDVDEFGDLPAVEDENKVRLREIGLRPRSHFTYTYDFGDTWEHDITVDRIAPPEPNVVYPCCLDGRRSGPPEDCGGPPGYAEFLKAIRNPKHPEHKEMLQWSGPFDPEAFSVEKLNRILTGKRAAGRRSVRPW